MKIKRILHQSRRDFKAEFECEHCGSVVVQWGYDDANFYRNVIPAMKCKSCGLTAGDDYVPRNTKYQE